MSLADTLKDGDAKNSQGFCPDCNRMTNALWERFGDRLHVWCTGCGKIIINDENRFKNN